MSKINLDSAIFEKCKLIDSQIPGDLGGGSPLDKTFLIAYLVQNQNLQNFIEIGVYKGKSLFPIAYSIYKNGGKSYGNDPYDLNKAKEVDVEGKLKKKIDAFLDNLDFENLYNSVILFKEKCGFGDNIKIIRKSSEEAITYFTDNNIEPDIVHIDGNHDTKYVKQDYENYYKILKDGGFLIFDDINWDSVKVVYEQAKTKCIEVFTTNTFGILLKQPRSTKNLIFVENLAKRLNEVYTKTLEIMKINLKTPTVSVGILTYNQVDYIEECINSIVTQKGDFILKIFICDDSSNDGTSEKIEELINNIKQNKNIEIKHIKNKINLGVIKNLAGLVDLMRGSDYFTFCEGDDYYLSNTRIAEHLNYHKRSPETIISFNKILLYHQDSDTYEIFKTHNNHDVINTDSLIRENYIGNLAASFYDTRVLNYIDKHLFDIYAGEWMFNIVCSQYGDIGILNKPLSIYRKHSKGVWSGLSQVERLRSIVEYVDEYNKYLNFNYDKNFTNFRNSCIQKVGDNYIEELDLAIIDDVFPHPISGFRYQEFTSVLKDIKKSKVFTTGHSIHVLGNKSIEEILIDYKRNKPDLAEKVQAIYDIGNFRPKLLYCIFLGNAYYNVLPVAEKYKIPFIFTLYPGGSFGLEDENSDLKLKCVLDSPYFKKVIVTQQITYDYLIKKQLCPPEKIEFIFGVVIPIDKLELNITNKAYYSYDKNSLDICFVAHKYTKFGEDKGYDLFIASAKELSRKYNNVNFHVVGPFDENVLDINGIKNIKFYGTQDQDWLDNFYKDKDIILSPNINGKIFKGNFDGFPTGCATDAAIRKVAMFCTDPLNLNLNNFIDGKNIVIIKHDLNDIVNKIEFYLNNPDKLKSIGEEGCKRVKEIYSYKSQIEPRLKILKQTMNESFVYPESINNQYKTSKISLIKRFIPQKLKKGYYKSIRLIKKLKTI